MTEGVDILLVQVHVLSAAFWVGGLIYVNIFLKPLVDVKNPAQKAFVRSVSRRFDVASGIAFIVLLSSGALEAWRMGLFQSEILLHTGYGLLLVGIMVTATIVGLFMLLSIRYPQYCGIIWPTNTVLSVGILLAMVALGVGYS